MSFDQICFRVIDTETTGLDPATAGVCEVAFQDVYGGGQRGRQFSQMVNPGHPIPPGASAIHHIVDEDVVGAPLLSEVLPELLAPPAPGVVPVYVAHSADFDHSFLPQLEGRWLCTHRLAKHLWPDLQGHGNEEVRYSLKLQPQYPRGTSHRATADVATTVEILLAGLARAAEVWPEITTVDALIERVGQPCLLTYVPFRQHKGKKFTEVDDGLLDWILYKGAGGPDCVHTAGHELRRRAEARRSDPDEDGPDAEEDDDFFPF